VDEPEFNSSTEATKHFFDVFARMGTSLKPCQSRFLPWHVRSYLERRLQYSGVAASACSWAEQYMFMLH